MKSIAARIGYTWRSLLRNEEGATSIEYGLIGAFIAVALLAGLGAFTPAVTQMYANIVTQLELRP